MIKIHNDFPVYLIRKFHVPLFGKKKIIKKILENKNIYEDYYKCKNGHSIPLNKDYNNFFKKLYSKYYNFCYRKFNFTKHPHSKSTCWSYVSDKKYFEEFWHNHIMSSTINGVYYLNVPKNDNVTIDFELNKNILTHKVSNYDLLIFPNYLNHKPNRCYKDGYRISINMEIICNESSVKIFNELKK